MDDINTKLTDDNFVLYAAKNYHNPSCVDTNEFLEDLKRFQYLKRLFAKFDESHELKERLVLNHIIILYNLFGVTPTTRMLFFKMEEYSTYLRTILEFLQCMPDEVHGLGDNNITINKCDIRIDPLIKMALENI